MNGTYLSARQRIQIAHQSRKSHLILGGTSHKLSTTQTTYHRPTASSVPSRSATNRRTVSHFSFGRETPSKSSEFARNYKHHSLEPRNPRPAIVDLTPSCIILGTQTEKFRTTSRIHRDLSGSSIESFTNSTIKNRRTNFWLGNDKSPRTSLMKKDYSRVLPEKCFEVQKNLLDSHVVMGNHPHMFKSSAKKEYFRKEGKPGVLPNDKLKDFKQKHFDLGNGGKIGVSVQNTSFIPLGQVKNGLDEDKLKYLKNSHFGFKAEQTDYKSMAKTSMEYSKAEIREQPQYLKVNHVVFGDDKHKPRTNYSRNYHYTSNNPNAPYRTKSEEMHSDIILGVTTPIQSTTTNSLITGKSGIPGRMDRNYENMLRTHHYTLGNTRNIYEQAHKNYGTGSPSPTQFLQGLKVDLLATHWTPGMQAEKMTSSMKNEYRPVAGTRTKCEDYLKKHNHQLGNSQNNWNSSYNGGFKWIQPVTGPSPRFSFN